MLAKLLQNILTCPSVLRPRIVFQACASIMLYYHDELCHVSYIMAGHSWPSFLQLAFACHTCQTLAFRMLTRSMSGHTEHLCVIIL